MRISSTKQSGLSLQELLIVIAIIAILAGILIVNFFSSIKKGRDSRRKADLSQIQRSLELYYEDNKHYPIALYSAEGRLCSDNGCDEQIYMKYVPKDPVSDTPYCYETDANGSYYKVYAALENNSDQQVENGLSCAGSAQNYQVYSPNVTGDTTAVIIGATITPTSAPAPTSTPAPTQAPTPTNAPTPTPTPPAWGVCTRVDSSSCIGTQTRDYLGITESQACDIDSGTRCSITSWEACANVNYACTGTQTGTYNTCDGAGACISPASETQACNMSNSTICKGVNRYGCKCFDSGSTAFNMWKTQTFCPCDKPTFATGCTAAVSGMTTAICPSSGTVNIGGGVTVFCDDLRIIQGTGTYYDVQNCACDGNGVCP